MAVAAVDPDPERVAVPHEPGGHCLQRRRSVRRRPRRPAVAVAGQTAGQAVPGRHFQPVAAVGRRLRRVAAVQGVDPRLQLLLRAAGQPLWGGGRLLCRLQR